MVLRILLGQSLKMSAIVVTIRYNNNKKITMEKKKEKKEKNNKYKLRWEKVYIKLISDV